MPTTEVIDLSHHNTVQSLKPARVTGVLGVIHKLTQGTSFIDEKCEARRYLAQEAQMLWGMYHYLDPDYPMKSQIDFFLKHAQPLMDDQTLLCLDYEESLISLTQVLGALEYLEEQSDRSPVLYSGHVLKDKGGAVNLSDLTKYRLWLAQYASTPTLPDGYSDYWLWQFTDSASISGIDGNVDCNHYQGSNLAAEWSGKTQANETVVRVAVPKGVKVIVTEE